MLAQLGKRVNISDKFSGNFPGFFGNFFNFGNFGKRSALFNCITFFKHLFVILHKDIAYLANIKHHKDCCSKIFFVLFSAL